MPYYFEDQVLDPLQRELSRNGSAIVLEPKVFDLLVYLIENRDRVVTKDDLIANVWGRRVVSDSAVSSAINAARTAIGDSGQEQRLIRTSPRKGVRFVGTLALLGSAKIDSPNPAFPSKPSIAVLPFRNSSGELEQEYFADGIVDDIITALSRFKSLFVIARNSSFAYKGRSVDVRQVGRELGVRYVLEGSVRKSGGRVRITGQLIDCQSGAHLWADRFEGALEDVFDLQDKVTVAVVGLLPITIQQAEIDRVIRRQTASLDAYDSFLLAMRGLHHSTRESLDEALHHFYRAIELDPEFADSYAWASIAYGRRKQSQWMTDVGQESKEGVRLARRGADLRPDNALALGAAGFALAFLAGEIAAGIDFVDRSLALNSNDAQTWHGSSWIRCYNGDHDVAIEHVGHAERLSPVDPQMAQFQLAKCMALYCAGRYEEAATIAEKVVRRQPNLVPALSHYARSAAMAGRLDDARRAMARALKLNPQMRISTVSMFSVMRQAGDSARIREGLLKAGMPE